MSIRLRGISLILTMIMLLSLVLPVSAIAATGLDQMNFTVKAGQTVKLLTEIQVPQGHEAALSESHTSGGAGLTVNIMKDPENSSLQVVYLEGKLSEVGTYKYTVTAIYEDSFGRNTTVTQDVMVEAIKGYTDEVAKDQTNINVDYSDKFAHNLPENVKIEKDRPNTLASYGLSATCDKQYVHISGKTVKTGVAQVTVSAVDADGITSYYTVQITITDPSAWASTVNQNLKVGETVHLQIAHGLTGTPVWDVTKPNTLNDFNLVATPGTGMLTISGTPLKPGNAEISFTDGTDQMTVKLTIKGSDLSTRMSYMEILGLKVPVEGDLPATSLDVDHKAVSVIGTRWTYVKDGEDVAWDTSKPFDLTKRYACYVTVNAIGGYCFAQNILVYFGNVNAEDVDIVEVNETTQQLTACFYFGKPEKKIEILDKIRIDDVPFPTKSGMTVADSIAEMEDETTVNGKISLDYITWSEANTDGTLSSKATLLGGTTYTCRFILEIPADCAFAEAPDASVNGDKNVKITRNGEKLAVAYNYTIPGEKPSVKPTYSETAVTCQVGDKRSLTVNPNLSADYDVDYQWFYNTKKSMDGAIALTGATGATLPLPTNIEGTNYYFCKISAIRGTEHLESSSDILVQVSVTPSDYVFPFTDVGAGQWYRSYVEMAHKSGLINGKTDTLYKPDDNMTLAECVKLAACIHQLKTVGEITLQNGNPWYQPYLDYAKENRIVDRNGDYSDTAMKKAVNRALYVDIFCYAMPVDELTTVNDVPKGSLPDVPADHPYASSIYKMYQAGIINGNDAKGTFGPDSNIKRSAVAAILVRMMDKDYRVDAPAELGQ